MIDASDSDDSPWPAACCTRQAQNAFACSELNAAPWPLGASSDFSHAAGQPELLNAALTGALPRVTAGVFPYAEELFELPQPATATELTSRIVGAAWCAPRLAVARAGVNG